MLPRRPAIPFLLNRLLNVGVAVDRGALDGFGFAFALEGRGLLERVDRGLVGAVGGFGLVGLVLVVVVWFVGVGCFAGLAAFDDLADPVSGLGLDVASFALLDAHPHLGLAVSVDGGDKPELLLGLPCAEQDICRPAGVSSEVIQLGGVGNLGVSEVAHVELDVRRVGFLDVDGGAHRFVLALLKPVASIRLHSLVCWVLVALADGDEVVIVGPVARGSAADVKKVVDLPLARARTFPGLSASLLSFGGLLALPFIPGEDDAEIGADGARIADGSAEHIFRDAEGHLAEDTPENRALIEGAVKPGNYVETKYPGVDVYREVLPNGTQVWTEVKGGSITNGGVNTTPR